MQSQTLTPLPHLPLIGGGPMQRQVSCSSKSAIHMYSRLHLHCPHLPWELQLPISLHTQVARLCAWPTNLNGDGGSSTK